jgi:hypothetical protein
MRRFSLFGAAIAALTLLTGESNAAVFTWTVSQASSFARITVADQSVTYSGITANVRPRAFNASSASNAWTDATGRLAAIAGSFEADYTTTGLGDTLLQFTGADSLSVVQSFAAQPNPASWNGTTYTNTTTAPAEFASRVYLNALGFLNTDLRLALRNIDISLSSSSILLGGGTTIPTNSTNLGLDNVSINLKGNTILGIAIPDVNTTTDVDPLVNTLGGSVISLGGLNRQLTLNINIPVSIPVDATTIVSANIAGRSVATATVPEISSGGLAALGMVAAGIVAHRRRSS